jgi:glyoxylase-like metal-dependent hydrolase (beta-lactamase superfamily II)
VAASKLKPPTLLFPKEMIFDDGKRRVELHYFGVAHTHGDGFAWLPKEKILFTGDACVNGPYNYVGDGDSGEWIKTLEAAQKLNPEKVGPGHGPWGNGSLLEDQKRYFVELRKQVKQRIDQKKNPEQMKAAVEEIRTALRSQQQIAPYVGDSFASHVEKVYTEMGGQPFQPKQAAQLDRDEHGHGGSKAKEERTQGGKGAGASE